MDWIYKSLYKNVLISFFIQINKNMVDKLWYEKRIYHISSKKNIDFT